MVIGGGKGDRDFVLMEKGADGSGGFVFDVEVEDGGMMGFEEGDGGCEGRNVSR